MEAVLDFSKLNLAFPINTAVDVKKCVLLGVCATEIIVKYLQMPKFLTDLTL